MGNRFCTVCNKEIQEDVCYEIMMSFFGGLDYKSITEVSFEKSTINKETCENCKYFNLD